ncbi:hypothetical protein CONLIGDRAFT_200952 [Coniochaeta ligniaria NRRL 30616]|uniref:Uncharacterized protein n=1 Tax=Coniochaeta ligniaria NRRL 30616 TaxID=1408157 RepID=A0A1J7JV39_9PEZI|nr:hypothetical protein CONLIGDRAFT_200952 [Coniochaeta ligniaria NRRL 30616]
MFYRLLLCGEEGIRHLCGSIPVAAQDSDVESRDFHLGLPDRVTELGSASSMSGFPVVGAVPAQHFAYPCAHMVEVALIYPPLRSSLILADVKLVTNRLVNGTVVDRPWCGSVIPVPHLCVPALQGQLCKVLPCTPQDTNKKEISLSATSTCLEY